MNGELTLQKMREEMAENPRDFRLSLIAADLAAELGYGLFAGSLRYMAKHRHYPAKMAKRSVWYWRNARWFGRVTPTNILVHVFREMPCSEQQTAYMRRSGFLQADLRNLRFTSVLLAQDAFHAGYERWRLRMISEKKKLQECQRRLEELNGS